MSLVSSRQDVRFAFTNVMQVKVFFFTHLCFLRDVLGAAALFVANTQAFCRKSYTNLAVSLSDLELLLLFVLFCRFCRAKNDKTVFITTACRTRVPVKLPLFPLYFKPETLKTM